MVGFYSGDPVDSTTEEAAGTGLIPSTTGQQLGAQLQQGIAETPVARLYRLADSYDQANAAGTAPLSADDANAKYGIPGQLSFAKPTFDAVASSLSDEKHAQLARQDILDRGQGGIVSSVGGFGARMLPQFFDPLNIAAAFVPGLGETRAAALLGRAGIESGLATRAVAGATQGALGQAALEPLNYGLDRSEHEDWSMGTALSDVAFGGLLGGGLHAVGGRLHGGEPGRGGPEAAPELGEAAAEGVAAPADAPLTPDQAANPITARMEAAGPEARDAALREGIAGLAEDRPNNVNEGLGLNDTLSPEPAAGDSLLTFLTKQGGVRDPGGDLAAMDAGKSRVGFLRKNGGLPLDEARSRAEQAGYLPAGSDTNTLLDAVDSELRGQKQFANPSDTLAYQQVQRTFHDQEAESIARYGAEEDVRDVESHLDQPLSDDERDHATTLAMQGMHPEEAVYQATRASAMEAGGYGYDPATDALSAFRRSTVEDTPEVAAARRGAEAVQEQAPAVAATDRAGQLGEAQAAYDKVRGLLDASGDENVRNQAAGLDENDALTEGDAKAYEAIGMCSAGRL